MASDPQSPGRRGWRPPPNGTHTQSADGVLLRQLLAKMDDFASEMAEVKEIVAKAPTREDLRTLVPRDTYDVQHAADMQRAADSTLRLTKAEQDISAMRESVHELQVADAKQFGRTRVEMADRVGTVADRSASEQINQLRWMLTAATAVITALLGYVVAHLIH